MKHGLGRGEQKGTRVAKGWRAATGHHGDGELAEVRAELVPGAPKERQLAGEPPALRTEMKFQKKANENGKIKPN